MLKQVSFLGKRDFFVDCPNSLRTRSIKSAASDRSRIVNEGLRPIWLAYSLSNRAPIAWNVPDHGRSTCCVPRAVAVIRFTRRIISSAARRVNVKSRMRCGSTPLTTRCATRWARVFVFPDPAPAITSSGGAVVAHSAYIDARFDQEAADDQVRDLRTLDHRDEDVSEAAAIAPTRGCGHAEQRCTRIQRN